MVHEIIWLLISLIIGFILLFKFLPIQVSGLGFARLASLTLTLPKVPTSLLTKEWSAIAGLDFDSPLFRLFRTVKFALHVTDLSIGFDRVFLLNISSICITVNIYPEKNKPTTSKPSSSKWTLQIFTIIAKNLFKLARLFLRINVENFKLILNHLEPEESKNVTIINILQFDMVKFQIFPTGNENKIIYCDSLTGHSLIKKLTPDSPVTSKEILSISDIQLCHSTEDGLLLEIRKIGAKPYPINLIFFVSAFGSPVSDELHQDSQSNGKKDLKSVPNWVFPGVNLFWIKVHEIDVKAAYPKYNKDIDRFKCLGVTAKNVQLHGSIEITAFDIVPKSVFLCEEVKITAEGLDKPGFMMQSIVHRFFNIDIRNSTDDLILIKDIFVANCMSPDIELNQPESLQLQSQYIKSCLNSDTPWNILSSDRKSNPSESSDKNVALLYQKFSHSMKNIFISESMNIITQTVLINTASVAIQVPFEFPLSNLLDHLIFLIKGIQAPLFKKSDRQSFNPFKYSWNLRFQSGMAALKIEDESFERRLSKCLQLKRQLYNKIDRLDRRFWAQCRENIKKERKMSAEDLRHESVRWVDPDVRPLVGASAAPETLKINPHLIRPYIILQEKAFEMYRRLSMETLNDRGKYLFDLNIKELDFNVSWKEDNVTDLATLLNRIDREENISSQDIEEMGVLLGGFVDIYGKNVEIQLKDFPLPLVYSDILHVAGCLFLVEEPSYPEALSHNLIEMSPFGGKWNIRGLDEFCQVMVKRTILPVKTYHSLCITIASLTNESPIIFGYSPLYEGTFQMLDRSFELFTKPSEELSPFLPFWDKMRLLLRGSNTLLTVNGPCHFVTVAGVNLDNTNESITLAFPSGFTFSMEESTFNLKVPSAAIFWNTKEQALLVWLHQKFGFQKSDLEEIKVFPPSILGDMLLVSFPEIEVVVRLDTMGVDGRKPAPHGTIKVCAATNEVKKPSNDIDSYRFFRIHQLSLIIELRTLAGRAATSKLLVFYFREIEEWFRHVFMQYVMPPVRPGNLFKFATLSRKATPKLSLVLNDIRLKVDFKGDFCARGMQYYNTETFGGVLLHSRGRNKLLFCWRKSGEHKNTNINFNQWYWHLAEIGLAKTKIAIITSEVDEESRNNHLMAVNLPLNFGDATVYDVFEASQFFYFRLDYSCFRNDPEAAQVQRKLIEGRLKELSAEIDFKGAEMRKMDPSMEVAKFAEKRRKLATLIDQQSLMAKFIKPPSSGGMAEQDEHNNTDDAAVTDDSTSILYYQFILQNARFVWHQAVRNSVFTMVDEQFQYFRCTQVLKDLVMLFRRGEVGSNSGGAVESEGIIHNSSPHTTSPLGTQAAAKQFLDELLMHSEGPMIVDPENERANDDEWPEGKDREREVEREIFTCDPAKLNNHGMQVSTRIDFEMTFPQLVLMDAYRDEMQAAIVLNAQSASLAYGTVRVDDVMVGRRTKISLENAKLYTAFRSSFPPPHHQWPPIFPTEYLLSRETESGGFKRMSDKVRMTVVYDVSNKRLKYENMSSAAVMKKIFGQGDAVRVSADPLLLHTDSSQFSVLYDVIVNLLVYRDETQKMRSEQLESIILAANLLQKSDMLNTVISMQKDLIQRYRKVLNRLRKDFLLIDVDGEGGGSEGEVLLSEYSEMKVRWDEVALIVDAMRTAAAQSNAKDQLKQRQTRLELTVNLPRIQWTMIGSSKSEGDVEGSSSTEEDLWSLCEMKLDGIHNNWISAPDGTQSNLIEIYSIKAMNLTTNAFYKTILAPIPEEVRKVFLTEGSGYRGVGTMGNAIRFYFKAQPPVAGIKLIELVELNLSPLQIQITYEMVEEFIKFFFPPIATPTQQGEKNKQPQLENSTSLISNIKRSIKSTASTFLSKLSAEDQIDDEDLSLMAARSAENCSFVYINVPASQHLISYKGRGEISITDVENFTLRLPDFEYHSQIWSWLEFFLQLRRDTLKILLSNLGALVKDKIKRLGVANIPESDDRQRFGWILSKSRSSSNDPEEENERKAKLLLGKSYNPHRN